MDISTLQDPQTPSDWIGIGDLRSYMMDKDYLEGSEFGEISTFFQNNFRDILFLLNSNYNTVREALKKRGNHRAKLKWGTISQNKDDNVVEKQNNQQKKPKWKI